MPLDLAFDALTDVLARQESVWTLVSVWTLITVFVRVLPRAAATATWARLAPVVPILLAEALVWIPGVAPPDVGPGPRALYGLVLGAVAAWGHKFVKQTGRGEDRRLVPPGST